MRAKSRWKKVALPVDGVVMRGAKLLTFLCVYVCEHNK